MSCEPALGASLVAWYDLPQDDARSHGLSGIAWDAQAGALHAVPDRPPRIVALIPSDDLRRWSFGAPLPVTGLASWDAEAIALDATRLLVADEDGPRVHVLDRAGRRVGEVPLPPHLARARKNRSLESLAVSPDGRSLLMANEQALEPDGPLASAASGTTVRITRLNTATGAADEFVYRTEPVFAHGPGGDAGVSDITALSGEALLILERGYVPGAGNDARIYCATLAPESRLPPGAALGESTPRVAKTLVIDLAALPDDGFPETLQPQRTRLLDNFEGLALGPRLPGGRRALFVVSDDNSRPTQRARILVLALAPSR